jgi:hypothetical protein
MSVNFLSKNQLAISFLDNLSFFLFELLAFFAFEVDDANDYKYDQTTEYNDSINMVFIMSMNG